jgi:hypothetical protein
MEGNQARRQKGLLILLYDILQIRQNKASVGVCSVGIVVGVCVADVKREIEGVAKDSSGTFFCKCCM